VHARRTHDDVSLISPGASVDGLLAPTCYASVTSPRSIVYIAATMDLPFLLIAGVLVVVLPLLYTYGASHVRSNLPMLRNKRICLLIAHPDDEAMFFAPTVLALTRPELGNHVKILCLSTGNADGLGDTRRRELAKSGRLLGLGSEDDVLVIDSP
jgi:N-acetylglucosaminylphosphatidylinositol deacetylase